MAKALNLWTMSLEAPLQTMSLDVQNLLLVTMSLETVSLENKSVSALNVADTVDNIYIYLYTA